MNFKQNNTAYDLSLFEEEAKKNKILLLPKIRVVEKRRRLKKVSTRAKAVSFGIFFISCLSATIFAQIQLTETIDHIQIKKEKLNEIKSICTQMELKRNAAFSSNNIEQYAEKSGMHRNVPSQVEFINLNK